MAIKDYFIRFKVSEEDKNTLFAKTNTYLGRRANYFIVALIIISLILMIFASLPSISGKYIFWVWITNFVINSIFCFEYIYRFSRSSHKLEFPFRILSIFHLLSFAPFFVLSVLFGVGNYSIFAIFRVFRLFKIFELLERNPIISKIFYGVKEHKFDYLTIMILTSIMLLFFSVIVYTVELNWGDKQAFPSLPDTLWWSFVTMTTTGYGDIIPITMIGRIVAIILMISGPIITAVIGAITILVFLHTTENIAIESKECEKCSGKILGRVVIVNIVEMI